jgi:hypothetical protein
MYPNIFPVEPGKDGWRPPFNTPTARLLFHCGLMPMMGKKGVHWVVAIPVPDSVKSQEVQPINVSFGAMRNVLRRVVHHLGKREALVILKEAAGVQHIADVKREHFRAIYMACQAALNREPKQLR